MPKELKFLFFLLFATVLIIWYPKTESKPLAITRIPLVQPIVNNNHHYLDKLNKRNNEVQSIAYDSVALKITQNGISQTIKGSIYFKKNWFFRATFYSFLGKEADIGSNNQYFWFWSKRLDTPGPKMFYALHENATRTGLKVPFYPGWIMQAFGSEQVEGTVLENAEYFGVLKNEIGPNGILVKKITLYDKINLCVKSVYLFDRDNKIIISTEVLESYNHNGAFIPKTIETIWYEENIKMQWYLSNPKVNLPISPRAWEMPNYQKEELGK